MNQRDDDFARLAAEVAQADRDVIEAERMENQAATKANAARITRSKLMEKMAEFVGPNIRTRNAVVAYKLIRVEYRGGKGEHAMPRVDVTVEDVTISRGDA